MLHKFSMSRSSEKRYDDRYDIYKFGQEWQLVQQDQEFRSCAPVSDVSATMVVAKRIKSGLRSITFHQMHNIVLVVLFNFHLCHR